MDRPIIEASGHTVDLRQLRVKGAGREGAEPPTARGKGVPAESLTTLLCGSPSLGSGALGLPANGVSTCMHGHLPPSPPPYLHTGVHTHFSPESGGRAELQELCSDKGSPIEEAAFGIGNQPQHSLCLLSTHHPVAPAQPPLWPIGSPETEALGPPENDPQSQRNFPVATTMDDWTTD